MARSAFAAAVVLVLLFVPATAPEASALAPLAPPPGTVWTVYTTVEATVTDDLATVKVIADIGNRGPDPEFPFEVQVPDGAYVTGLSITRDGQTHHASIQERQAARAAYDAHKASEMTGGLVEKQRGMQTYAYLINVAAFESVRAVLVYEQYLAPETGIRSLRVQAPVSGFGEDLGAAFDIQVVHSGGIVSSWSDPAAARGLPERGVHRFTHSVPPRSTDDATPFAVHYILPGTTGAGSIAAYAGTDDVSFVHRLRAPTDAERLPLDLVVVMDTSGSMSGLKIEQLKDAASQLVAGLSEGDRLHLVMFSSDATSAWNGMRAMDDATRQDALSAVQGISAMGGTNIAQAIVTGFAAFEQDGKRLPILVFLTDGLGRLPAEELRQRAQQVNHADARVFSIAFGADADWSLVAGLAQDGGGMATRVEEGAGAEVDLLDFMAALTQPVLRDVSVTYDGHATAYRIGSDVLFAGSEVLLVGHAPAGTSRITGTLKATGPAGPIEHGFSVPVQASADLWVERLAAAQRIRMMEGQLAAGDISVRAPLLELALAKGFVTDVTSLVLLLDIPSPQCLECVAPPVWGEPIEGDALLDASNLAIHNDLRGWTGAVGGGAASPMASSPPMTRAAPVPTSEADTFRYAGDTCCGYEQAGGEAPDLGTARLRGAADGRADDGDREPSGSLALALLAISLVAIALVLRRRIG